MKKFTLCKFEAIILFAFGSGLFIGSRWRDVLRSNVSQVAQIRSPSSHNDYFEKQAHYTSTCSPQKDIFFLKTHKTAGTVVQNIILRYADRTNLFVGLSSSPRDARFRYAEGATFQAEFLKSTKHKINVLCHHMRYNDEEVRKVMSDNAKFITIIRDTGPMFESYFDYFHWHSRPFKKVANDLSGMEKWLDNADKYFNGEQDGNFWWFGKNGLAYDLGFNNLQNDEKYIQMTINEMEKTYDLVMISDYLEMSLILMKELLCLKMEDIAFLDLNSRLDKTYNITPKLDRKIRYWNKADAAIYEHFNQTFWKKVKAFGKNRMDNQVNRLRKMNDELRKKCVDGDTAVRNSKVKDPHFRVFNPMGVKMAAYNLKPDATENKQCTDVVKPEMEWFRYLLSKQFKK